jgi:hypothetical protein
MSTACCVVWRGMSTECCDVWRGMSTECCVVWRVMSTECCVVCRDFWGDFWKKKGTTLPYEHKRNRRS